MQSLEQWLELELGQTTQPVVPSMRRLTSAWKAAQTAQKAGDLSTLSRSLSQLKTIWEQILPALDRAADTVATYDLKSYLADLFDQEFREACAAAEFPVEGQYPRYVVYPIQVSIDINSMGVRINRKLHRGLRISHVMETIRTERSRLLARPFNARSFLADIASTYDGIIELESAKNQVHMAGHDVTLRHLYQKLVPMRQWRADYSERSFAFDLHRLLRSGETHEPGGRRLHLAPARESRNNLTVLDTSGRELQLGLISFRKD
jgi:hypothetical protein